MINGKLKTMATMVGAKKTREKGNMTKMCPPTKFGMFYKFLSFSQI